MKNLTQLAFALALVSMSSPAVAQQSSYGPRGQAVHTIVKKWAPHVQRVHGRAPSAWASDMGPVFARASLASLKAAARARSFDEANALLLAPATPSGKSAVAPRPAVSKSLGSVAADLTFVPISPCRILDTRLAGGPIPSNGVRHFDVTAVSDYSFQGGAATNCNGMGAAGSFAAIAINLTSVLPESTGYFTAYPYLATRPVAATQVYFPGDIRSNLAIVQLDQGASASEMTIFSEHTLHLVGDVVGYFIAPEPTALQCQDTANVSVDVNAGATANVVAAACAAGFTQTATNCESSTWQMPFVFAKGGTCSAQNNSGSQAQLRASRTCCRVPGR